MYINTKQVKKPQCGLQMSICNVLIIAHTGQVQHAKHVIGRNLSNFSIMGIAHLQYEYNACAKFE